MSSWSAADPPAPRLRGCSGARGVARSTVLDRSAFPRNKPCGGGISRAHSYDFLTSTTASLASLRTFCRGCTSRVPNGESVVIESDGPAALMIRRVEFDALLLVARRGRGR